MLSQTVNGLERRTYFRPAWHKVNEDPAKDYGVHGMEIWFVLIGPKGAVHFGLSTGMMLTETIEWWRATGRGNSTSHLFPMGIDVGYHSPVPMHDFQKESGPVWPTKIRKTGDGMLDVVFDKVGDAPPNCEYIGVPCYSDGSALRADDWKSIFLAEGDDIIWEMLEEDYNVRFLV